MDSIITMAHGSGGKKTSELIENIFMPAFSNNELNKLNDGAYIKPGKGKVVFSTDSFVVKPLFFPGGNIGKLSVCGTVNDISVCGGIPLYLSIAFIIEEGFAVSELRRIVDSIRETSMLCGVSIVTGDTKVVERGLCDGVYINTSGIGIADPSTSLGAHRIIPGDKVIVSGSVGDHGLSIMAARERLFEDSRLESDCAPINGLAKIVLEYKDHIKIMRDPTRGGLATTLKEFVEKSSVGIKIHNDLIPVKDEVQGACEILGIDPLYAANEGKLIVIASSETADYVADSLRSNALGKDAAVIGEVVPDAPGRLLLDTGLGSIRVLDKLSGDQLPRIC